jgi:hypothetical protein
MGPYEVRQRWTDADVEHATWWMRELADDPFKGQTLGTAAQANIQRVLAPSVVGTLTKDRILTLDKR